MSKKVTVSAPGKIYLMGEHAVVYGKPGLLAAIDKRCKATLTLTHNSQAIQIIDQKLNTNQNYSIEELTSFAQKARKLWQQYDQTKDSKILKQIVSEPTDLIKIAIVENFAFYQKQFRQGFILEVDSDIPFGSGLGSSSALAVAISAAIHYLLLGSLDKNVINDIAYTVEQRQHGNPSGADNTIATFGGLLWYRKESPILKAMNVLSLSIPETFSNNLILVNTGTPSESTGEMVANVSKLYQSQPNTLNQFLQNQEQITRDLLPAIQNSQKEEFAHLLKQGEKNLETINVISPATKKFIKEVEKTGSVAKICGAGGYSQNSGIVLIFAKNKSEILKIINKFKLSYFQTQLAVEGVRIEN
jgi:mevalonate kinase